MQRLTKDLKLARGVLIRDEKVLLVQDIRPGQGHFFLPGGSVEFGEPIKDALAREWREELGWEVEADGFLGCIEHKWNFSRSQDGMLVDVVEVNYLFTVVGSEETLTQEPRSKEGHLRFQWVRLDELSSIHLLPAPLKSIIPDAATSTSRGIWVSTL